MKVHILKNSAAEYYFNLVSRNGQIIVTSEGYKRKSYAKKIAGKIFPSCSIIDETKESK